VQACTSAKKRGVGFIKSMTMDERHAELSYAERLLEMVGVSLIVSVHRAKIPK